MKVSNAAISDNDDESKKVEDIQRFSMINENYNR
jgi:hypothetical protein